MQRGSDDIWVARRPTREADFDDIRVIVANGKDHFAPTLTGDGLWLYFEETVSPEFPKIHRAAWDADNQTFGPPELVPGLRAVGDNRSYGDYDPYVIPSGDALYFHSAREWPYERIYRAARSGDTFLEPQVVQVPGSRGRPVVSPDELTLYYTRNVSGGADTADIWQVTRESTSKSFTDEQVVQGPNVGQYNELASFISEDGCRLYFDRNIPSLDQNAYFVERAPDTE